MAYCTWKSYKLGRLSSFDIFRALNRRDNCFFLDSSLNANYSLGRYSFLGIEPFLVLKTASAEPFSKLRELFKAYQVSVPKTKIPFLGGAVGYLGYDLGFALEKKIKPKKKGEIGIPGSYFGFYNSVLVIDHYKRLLHVFSLGFPEKRYSLAKSLAESNLKKIKSLLLNLNPGTASERSPGYPGQARTPQDIQEYPLSSNFTKAQYISAINKAKEYIKAGDIYQVNLSQQFNTRRRLPAADIYQRLRRISSSYFSAYFDAGDFQIISSSPERFLRLTEDTVTTVPMKGTRPRANDRSQDRKFKDALLKSKKDQAELVMIVDLERNDLGRVCDYDSVKVVKLRDLEQYSTVFQTTATVQGRLHRDKDRFDLLRACFPGGSITGCPKIRAMEIIDELEPTERNIYTGCLGYLSFSGDMDFNILIRTILKKDDDLYFGVGGGIVADSVAQEEYEETLVKAKAMIETVCPGAADGT